MKNAVRVFLLAALIATGWTPAAHAAASRDINVSFTVMQWINAVEIYAGKQIAARGEDAEVKATLGEEQAVQHEQAEHHAAQDHAQAQMRRGRGTTTITGSRSRKAAPASADICPVKARSA